MFCPGCGSANPETANWCAQCGASLRQPATPQPAAAIPIPVAPIAYNIQSHMVLAVFSLLCGFCCCFPGMIAAIVSLISAFSVNSRLAAGDAAGAQVASSRASFWGWTAVLCGILGLIANIIVGIIYGSVIVAWLSQAH